MRKKLISKTYLRDVRKYAIRIDYSNNDYWYSVKKIIDADSFILDTGLKVIDNGYYILELLPKNEYYSIRVYFNEKKEIIEYYFDISLENNIDEDSKIPYYDDAFIDITLIGDQIEILDEDELNDALANNVISRDEYNFIKCKAQNLYNEIKNKTNKYLNMDFKKMLYCENDFR